MYRKFVLSLPIALLLAFTLFPSVGFSQEKAEELVVVSYATDKGEKLAKSIAVF